MSIMAAKETCNCRASEDLEHRKHTKSKDEFS